VQLVGCLDKGGLLISEGSAETRSSKRREVIEMTREQMMDEVIRTNGFENKWTIWFCELAENKEITDSALQSAMVCALTMPMTEEEE
jgi:nicotinamide mononucleotide adenylyltransferase